ncbi:NAD-dependent epimerase/dehydratase family protein [Sphingomonas taxi]|uniref:NAD-dependent epimerase/dehydratase family protein n=1 Tax=Sphingomonas taxi TaxID=1549858 RepID=UPI0009DF3188|nr:NAD-dependent epimerase/dehydratase family protein [Sphingomonas taxi]
MTHYRRNVIVTGASGIIGAAIVDVLARAGFTVTAVARSPAAASVDNVRPLRVNRYEDLAAMPDLLEQTETIFHFADRANRKMYDVANRGEAADLMKTLASAAVDTGVCGIVLASSIYADRPNRSAYGWSKQAAEQVLAERASEFRVAISLRLPPVYGHGSRGMFASLAKHVAAGHPLPLGAATAPRRFLGIENLGDLTCLLARSETPLRGIYAPADPEPINLAALSSLIGSAVGRGARLVPVPFIDLLSRDTIVDATVARQQRLALEVDLGWRPRHTTAEQLGYLS